MYPFIRTILGLLAGLLLAVSVIQESKAAQENAPTHASRSAVQQQTTPTPAAEPTTTAEPERAAGARRQTAGPTPAIAPAATLTETVDVEPQQQITRTVPPTTTLPLTASGVLTGADLPGAPRPVDESLYSGVLEGTILANRTEATVRFFVEGQMFVLDPLRSLGLALPRVSAVLNLFNCDAATPDTQSGCYWDPYLLDRDSMYEIVTGADTGKAVNLTLREAGAPSLNEIWIQNRTGVTETVVYRNTTYELSPASIQEFTTDTDQMPTFFLRSCVSVPGGTACEWLPVVGEAGVYYSLMEIQTAGGLPGSRVTALQLRPILAGDAETIDLPAEMICRLQVPTLNVRSGPGLDYQIVAKIRGTAEQPATVLVVGRDGSGEWLAVGEQVAAGGWIAGNASYVSCDGDLFALPETVVTDGRLVPTPEPAPQSALVADTVPAADNDSEAPPTAAEEAATPTPMPLTVPPGLALLIVNNAFDHQIRFTIDQKYRAELGPSEIDLQPGASTSLVVYPGFVPFSASSPWSELSGNEALFMEENQSRTLWLIFLPDPDGSKRWILQY